MGKTISIPADRSEQILGPDDRFDGDAFEDYSGFLVHVSGGDIKLDETLGDRGSGARDGVTVADGTTFSISAEPITAVHAFADGAQVTIEVSGFHRKFGEWE
jgi:hypothetical protein